LGKKNITKERRKKNKKEKKPIAYFVEPVKPMVLNSTNCKTISRLYGTPDIEKWTGKKIQIFPDYKVKAFGDVTEGLRIRASIPKDTAPVSTTPVKCVDCSNPVVGFGEYTAEQIAYRNNEKYGRVICVECAKKLKAAETVAPENTAPENTENNKQEEATNENKQD